MLQVFTATHGNSDVKCDLYPRKHVTVMDLTKSEFEARIAAYKRFKNTPKPQTSAVDSGRHGPAPKGGVTPPV